MHFDIVFHEKEDNAAITSDDQTHVACHLLSFCFFRGGIGLLGYWIQITTTFVLFV